MELRTLEKRLENEDRVKIHLISFFESVPDLFTGYAFNSRINGKSLLLDLCPWLAHRTSDDHLLLSSKRGRHLIGDTYYGLRLYDSNHLTTSFDTHKRKVYRLLKELSIEETQNLERYLRLAQRL